MTRKRRSVQSKASWPSARRSVSMRTCARSVATRSSSTLRRSSGSWSRAWICSVRELTGGLYFGDRQEAADFSDDARAYDTMVYTGREVRRVVELAFRIAQGRRKKVTSVDK